jgi:hypothetical protein
MLAAAEDCVAGVMDSLNVARRVFSRGFVNQTNQLFVTHRKLNLSNVQENQSWRYAWQNCIEI